jgi:hypothetical protein
MVVAEYKSMTGRRIAEKLLCGSAAALFMLATPGRADEEPVTREQIRALQEQNEKLQQQLQKQQEMIDALTRKVSDIQNVNTKRDQDLSSLKAEVKEEADQAPPSAGPLNFGKVNISGEGGIGFFDSENKGQYPAGQFRVDEARLFVDAPIRGDVYFHTEIELASREMTTLSLNVEELYLDWQNVSDLWGREKMMNLRAGRFYIPFGEEYQNRFAIDNPLISHSLSDLWGTDDGVELYGRVSRLQYVVAVQSGGIMPYQDFTGDKSVTARIGYDPAKWLHLSVSGMRTGSLDVQNDMFSALWFSDGFIRSIGGPGTTRFHANLVEADAQLRFPWLRLNAAGGYIEYNDNDPAANNRRDIYYYYLEGVHDFTQKFYGAARFSQIDAPSGFPILGDGIPNNYFYGPAPELTQEYWRLSLGMGYRFSSRLLVKAEYSFNQGVEADDTSRGHENLFALEAAFKF